MSRLALRFEFNPLAESDISLLHEWLNRPHVVAWWDGKTSLAEVRDDYLSRCSPTTIRPYLACLDGIAVGFIQSYVVVATQASGWWLDERDPGAVGIDQFLADAHNLGKGIGTAMIAQFTRFLFADPVVTRIQTDPAPNNSRAIRCYEKAGFTKVGLVDTPDGAALLMVAGRRRSRVSSRSRVIGECP